MTEEEFQEILNIPVRHPSNKFTVKSYLESLLLRMWHEKSNFNGKRPFGSSAWEYDFYHGLMKAGKIRGTFDSEDFIATMDDSEKLKADLIIQHVIMRIFDGSKQNVD